MVSAVYRAGGYKTLAYAVLALYTMKSFKKWNYQLEWHLISFRCQAVDDVE